MRVKLTVRVRCDNVGRLGVRCNDFFEKGVTLEGGADYAKAVNDRLAQAEKHGWRYVDGKAYCPGHAPGDDDAEGNSRSPLRPQAPEGLGHVEGPEDRDVPEDDEAVVPIRPFNQIEVWEA